MQVLRIVARLNHLGDTFKAVRPVQRQGLHAAVTAPDRNSRNSPNDQEHNHMTVKVRQALRTDLASLFAIRDAVRENRARPGSISAEQVCRELEVTGRGWVVEVDGEVVGFAIGNARSGNVWALFVAPAAEGRGYGRRLHTEMVQWLWSQGLGRLWLTTGAGTRALGFYQQLGWRIVGSTASGEVCLELCRPGVDLERSSDFKAPIRCAVQEDNAAMVRIWLECSRLSHDFVPYEYWLERAPDMERLYLPNAESYVVSVAGELAGFASLMENHLAALFVQPSAQGRGYGRVLLNVVQGIRDTLSLCVYAKNTRAVQFYRNSGFRVVAERPEAQTRQPELVMEWSRRDADPTATISP